MKITWIVEADIERHLCGKDCLFLQEVVDHVRDHMAFHIDKCGLFYKDLVFSDVCDGVERCAECIKAFGGIW